ncbi:MAG: diacylglycerol kinase family protein [Erysipelotrichaceae bacterium]|nr:diacylglycerol kinase family protein [Erysipelotrichaceae bacterium]
MKKFKDAFCGLKFSWTHRSIVIQFLLAGCIFAAGLLLKFTPGEWLAVTAMCALVIASEIFNTCIEMICDKICPDYDETIGKIKDLSAAGVLVCALFALLSALIIVMF